MQINLLVLSVNQILLVSSTIAIPFYIYLYLYPLPKFRYNPKIYQRLT